MADLSKEEIARLVASSKRPLGRVVLTWEPNTGALNIAVEGLTLVEEAGLYTMACHMRMNANGIGMHQQARVTPVGLVKPS